MSEPGAPASKLKAHDAPHRGVETDGRGVVTEMIRLSLQYRSGGKGLTKTGVQKVLYALKHDLPEGNRVGQHLPYYWFKAGPFSEHVARGLDDLQSRGVVVEEDHGRYSVFKLGRERGRLIEHDDHIKEARIHLQQIVEDLHPLSVDPEIRAQYARYAPTPFYPKFKLDFMKALEAHRVKAEQGNVDLDQAAPLTEAIDEATVSLPMASLFRGFKRHYFDFEAACRRTFEWAKNGDKKRYVELIGRATDLSRQVWDTFAYGARIMEHDDAYNGRVPDWRDQFSKSVRDLSCATDDFYLAVLDAAGSEDGYEKAISKDALIDHIVEYRKSGEIAYIRFPSPGGHGLQVSDHARRMPEYRAFAEEGHLDWMLMKILDDSELARFASHCMTGRPVFVSYVETKPKTITYRMINTPSSGGNTCGP